jgi:hypothetical protein
VYKPDASQLQLPVKRADDCAAELIEALRQLIPPGEEATAEA